MSNLWEIFENINEIVYAADAETYELVYMNKKALDTFGIDSLENVKGEICYHILRNCAFPCTFCNAPGLKKGSFEQRRYFDPCHNRYFLLRHTLLEENDRQCHLMMALDIDEQEQQGNTMQSVQNLEAIINEGLRVALLEETPDRSLEVLLGYLGKALNGERTYIFERNELGGDDNTYEWVADGVQPEKEKLQNVPREVCAGWYENFSVGRYIVIENLEDIRKTAPLLYENLKWQNICSLVVVPLYDEGRILGFYGVDNPPVKSLEYTSNMLQITAHFIVSSIRRRNLVRELQKRSHQVLNALNVDYLGIYQVDFNTDKCEIYRENKRLQKMSAQFKESYQAAMEQYISMYVSPGYQESLQMVTQKGYVLTQLRTKKKFYVRYQVNDNPYGIKNMEIHFSVTGTETEENSVIFAFRDVNAVVEQEEKYKLEAKQSLEDILGGARTGIWTIELEEACEPRMYADRTMRMLLGVSEDTGPRECYRRWFENIDPDYVDMVLDSVQEMQENGRSEVVYPWNHPTLGKIYIRCGGGPDKKFDKPGVCLNGYHQDITEVMVTRKKQEQVIMELLEKVRQANSVKSEFLSHMSHDLRTPLNGIQGMLAVMENSQDDLEKQKDCREKIRISAEHLLTIVNDVLEVSKLENGRSAQMDEPFDLYELLENCIMLLAPKAEEHGIRLEMEKITLQHSRLIGNPLHLKQILTNIIDNGIKFNRPNGTVLVRAKEISFKGGFAGYQFTVKDTGIGIEEEFQKHIFEPFTQKNQGARTDYSGTGLGLAIVKKYVDQAGGTIEVESKPGRGSVFQVTLSIQVDTKKDAYSAGQKKEAPADIAGMNVLLVEDNKINCEIVKFILEKAGATVVTAEDGKVAVDTFDESEPGNFDCILMDLMMPVMSGLEAARLIRSMDRTDAKKIPIIALSANAFEEDVAMTKDAGMNEHLAKPVDINKMFGIMSRLRIRRGNESA